MCMNDISGKHLLCFSTMLLYACTIIYYIVEPNTLSPALLSPQAYQSNQLGLIILTFFKISYAHHLIETLIIRLMCNLFFNA